MKLKRSEYQECEDAVETGIKDTFSLIENPEYLTTENFEDLSRLLSIKIMNELEERFSFEEPSDNDW